jgi:hypothetical protein
MEIIMPGTQPDTKYGLHHGDGRAAPAIGFTHRMTVALS